MFNGIEWVSLGLLGHKQALELMTWSYGQEGGNLDNHAYYYVSFLLTPIDIASSAVFSLCAAL